MYISMHLAWWVHLDQWSIWSQYTNLEICVPYVVTLLNWITCLSFYMERFIILNGCQEDACYNDIGLCTQNMFYYSRFSWWSNWEGLCDYLSRKSIGTQLGYALTVLMHKMTFDFLHIWLYISHCLHYEVYRSTRFMDQCSIQWKESMATNKSTLFHLIEHKVAFMHADAMNDSMITTWTSRLFINIALYLTYTWQYESTGTPSAENYCSML